MRTVTADLDPDRTARAAEALAAEGVDMRRGEEPRTVVVGSFSGRDEYVVDLGRRTCTCPDSRLRGNLCKHTLCVVLAMGVAGE